MSFVQFAVLLVVLFHYTARLPAEGYNITSSPPLPVAFGWIGVFFFFILSGYCIFFTLARTADIASFFAKRASRVYPAFAAAAILLFVYNLAVPLPHLPTVNYHPTTPGMVDLIGNLLLLGGPFEWVNGSFWSITVEIQFYVLIGVLAFFIRDRARLTRVFTLISLGLFVAWFLAAQQADSGVFGKAATALRVLAIAPYLPFFAIGILGCRVRAGDRDAGWMMAATALLASVRIYSGQVDTSGSLMNLQVVCAVSIYAVLTYVFYSFCKGRGLPNIPVISPALARIGLLSYSWYLIHENVGITFLRMLNPHIPAWASVAVAIVATYALCEVFSFAFEWRFRKSFEGFVKAVLTRLYAILRGLVPALERPAPPAAQDTREI